MTAAREVPAERPRHGVDCPVDYCLYCDRPYPKTDAERTHEVAEELRAHGAVVTDAEVDAQLNATAKILGA